MDRRMAFEKLERALLYLLHRPEPSADALLVIIEAQNRVIYGGRCVEPARAVTQTVASRNIDSNHPAK